MNIQLDKPILFQAVCWDENWEFDIPALLLKPIIYYSPFSNWDLYDFIEEIAEGICLDIENKKEIINEDISREFSWRNWNIDRLVKIAEGAIEDKKYKILERS